MGEYRQSQLRRAENEVVFREHNAKVMQRVDQLLPSDNKVTYPVTLSCECSDETCRDKIELAVTEFFQLHKDSRHFILKPHHDQADIERVVERYDGFNVVEKFEVPPSTDGKLNVTRPTQ